MTTSSTSRTPRRTQRERREATVAKLVEATIEAIGEVGYQRATVQVICARAGLSVGAMFRQFDGRLELVAAALEEVVARHLQGFRDHVDRLDPDGDRLTASLEFLQRATAAPTTAMQREVVVAARGDAELRARIAPAVTRYYAAIAADVERAGVFDRFPPALREPLLFMMIHLFSGEALIQTVYPRPDLAASTPALAHDMLLSLASTLEHRTASPQP